ncbi:SigE family RNA polymerase sigma factor [Saccharopolyspora sp. K220]|uniref:SigE family RNA polymerase sigma factor n=1 Tax=Saccharopolyspora soli TaxID=2926618 RepID=UPI001F59F964|nr:SigE family RNA polymerase sigma factor [Saccharopolyspora soli]MCI2423569.1 SigE family RNA polymerase sigma factor [Saccharopolyspora soli]
MAKGDEQFVEFVRASSARLLHAAFLLTGNRHQAEDAAQTALARTYAAWTRVREQDAYAYARAVLTNHVIDGWRRPIQEKATDNVPESPVDADVADRVTRQDWLMRALDQLTARERGIIVLRYFFDLPETDVAAELRISLGTVKSTSSRALAKLRTALTPVAAEPLIGGEQP